MEAALAPLDLAEIETRLGSAAPRFALTLLAQCASTNSLLLDQPPPDDARVHVVAAERQSAGRGRRGRGWDSPPGAGLTFSMLWRFPPGAPVPAGLSLVVGLAVARSLEKLGLPELQLKWPNDVLVCGGKVAGILIELLSEPGRPPAAVVGIGINVTAAPELGDRAALAATALARHRANLPSRSALLAALLGELAVLLDTYAAAGFAPFRGAWEQRNAFAGRVVTLLGEADVSEGVCLGVDDDGALRLATPDGTRRVLSGDVSLRPRA